MSCRNRSLAVLAVLLTLCILASAVFPALASVNLISFEAVDRLDGSIWVRWQVDAEVMTSGYRLYRAELEAPAGWGKPLQGFIAGDGRIPQSYEYIDSDVIENVLYYYLLEDVSTAGEVTSHGPISAGIGLAANTPMPTATATTPPATNGNNLTITPPPTSTRQFTDVPLTRSAVTTAPGARPTTGSGVRPPGTGRPGAVVSTPTGAAPPPATFPAPTPTAAAPVLAAPVLTPTPQMAAVQLAGLETATPRPNRESTPIIFEAARTDATSTPPATAQVEWSPMPVLVIGGAFGLAGVLAAVLLFMRSRRG